MEARIPLTEICGPQAQRPHRQRMERVYGKSARHAVRSGFFVDENEPLDVAHQFAGMKISSTHDLSPQPRIAPAVSPRPDRSGTGKSAKESWEVAQRRSQTPIHSKDVTYLRPLFNQAEQANQKIRTFMAFAERKLKPFLIEKIGEGSFGECYRLIAGKSADVVIPKEGCILKIMIIDEANSMPLHNSVAQLIQETKIHKKLDEVAGFVRFRDVFVVQGSYPPQLLEGFRKFKNDPSTDAQNEDPQVKFSPHQQFAIFDMSHAGRDLENLTVLSAFQIFDIFWSLTMILQLAEKRMQYEHRDLHTGNVCYMTRKPGGRIDIQPMLNATMINRPETKFGLSLIKTTVIDYTMSRATLETGEVAYHPFTDFKFSTTSQNLEEVLQWKTYRRARECVKRADTLAKNAASSKKSVSGVHPWSRYVPKTNVVWLVYILDILTGRSAGLAGSSKVCEALQNEMFAQFGEILRRYRDCTVHKLPASADALLEIGLQEGWLTKGDVDAFAEISEAEGW